MVDQSSLRLHQIQTRINTRKRHEDYQHGQRCWWLSTWSRSSTSSSSWMQDFLKLSRWRTYQRIRRDLSRKDRGELCNHWRVSEPDLLEATRMKCWQWTWSRENCPASSRELIPPTNSALIFRWSPSVIRISNSIDILSHRNPEEASTFSLLMVWLTVIGIFKISSQS